MTARDKETLKSYFRGGYVPTEQQYVDLIDSFADFGTEGGTVPNPNRYLVFYNYNFANNYRIGLASGPNERSLTIQAEPIVNLGANGSWEDSHVKDPFAVDVDGILYLYYSGHDGTNFSIGLSRSFDKGITWVKYASNPILSASETWENSSISCPHVIYDRDETDLTKRWKMWYSGNSGSGGSPTAVGYAYSADGLTWTKFVNNPVIHTGANGSWDDTLLTAGSVIRLGDIFYMFYNGNNGSGTWQEGLATFTDPEGTYTKSENNPIFVSDGITSALTSNISIGDLHAHVSNATVFPIGAAVWIYDGSHHFLTTIAKQDSNTQISFTDPSPVAISSTGGNVRSVAYNSISIESVNYDGGWIFGGTAFQPLDGSGNLREVGILAWSNDLVHVYIDYGAGNILPVTLAESQGDNVSRENPLILDMFQYSGRFIQDNSRHGPVTVSDTPTVDLILSGQALSATVIPSGIKLDDLATPDNNTDLNTTTDHHGLFPILPGGTTNFYREDGTWVNPIGSVISKELLMQDGVTSPPVPLENEAQDDWLYQD